MPWPRGAVVNVPSTPSALKNAARAAMAPIAPRPPAGGPAGAGAPGPPARPPGGVTPNSSCGGAGHASRAASSSAVWRVACGFQYAATSGAACVSTHLPFSLPL